MSLFPLSWSRACELLPVSMHSEEARVVIAAIGYQESGFKHWRQIGGPAKGFWQFEEGGGVKGVMRHAQTRRYAENVADACCVAFDVRMVYNALPYNDVLACAFARLLLYTLPAKLPAVGDADAAWRQYIEAWRPGRPRPEHWAEAYRRGTGAVGVG